MMVKYSKLLESPVNTQVLKWQRISMVSRQEQLCQLSFKNLDISSVSISPG
jgi:hypothetical protein